MSKSRTKRKKRKRRKFKLKEWWQGVIQREKLILAILLFAALLRLVDLGRQSLWIDEMCVYNDSKSTYRRIFYTVHPVTFLLARTTLYLKDNEYFLRLPSAIAGILTVLLIYLLGKELFGRSAGIISAVLLACSPYHIYYSQDANYYAEMMFFSTLSILLLVALFRTRKILLLPLFLISLYVTYKTHLFCIFVVATSLVTLLVWILTDRELHTYARKQIAYLNQKNRIYVPAGLIGLIIIMSPILIYFIRLLMRYSFHYPSEGMRAENFQPSIQFFWKLATDYGIAFQDYILRNFLFTIVFVSFFLVGLYVTFRQRKIILFFFLLLLISPFIGLSIRRVQHFYHPRYTSFIVPIYVLCAGAGIDYLSRGVLGIFKRLKPNTQHLVAGALSAIIIFMMLPNLIRYYSGNKQDWRDAVLFLKNNAKPDDIVVAYLYCNWTALRFYYKFFGLDTSHIVKIPEVRGAGGATTGLSFLKKLCFSAQSDVYLASSYTRYEPPEIFDWVKTHFDTVLYIPSLHPHEINREGKEVVLYRWKYKKSYVLPPMIFRAKITAQSPKKGLFRRRLLFDQKGEYALRLVARDDVTSLPAVTLFIDGQNIGKMASAQGNTYLRITAPISAGVHLVELKPDYSTDYRMNALSGFKELQIYLWAGGKIHREAEEADFLHPTTSQWVRKDFGARCFTLKINTYLGYEHIFAENDTDYYFQLRALNDKPGPVLIEVSVDDQPVGILSFDKQDNTWGIKGFPLRLGAGEHTLRLHFLNNFKTGNGKKPDEDNDALIDYFELIPLDQFSGNKIDARVQVSRTDFTPIPHILTTFTDSAGGAKLRPEWQFASKDASYTLEKLGEHEAVHITVPPLSKGAGVVSVPFNVQPGKLLYFSLGIRTHSLNNHSANILVDFFGPNRQLLGREWVSDEGITGTVEEWIRYVYFRRIPQGVGFVRIQLVIYPNSKQFAKHSGNVWFSQLKPEIIKK